MDVRRVLIVDDSKLVCFKLGKMLEERGISSQAVHSGEEALAYLRANPPPDVAFIDIMMPGMDGFQTIAAIRAEPPLAGLPIIICSSNDTDADRAEATRRGANGFLPKPPASQQLFQTLASLSPAAVAAAPEAHKAASEQGAARPASDHATLEATGQMVRDAIAVAEQALQARIQDLTHRIALETEETARRVTTTLATETARKVAERVVHDLASQALNERLREVVETAGEATRNLARQLVPEALREQLPAIIEQAARNTTERLASTNLRPVIEAAVGTVLAEAKTRLHESMQANLARELPTQVAHAVSTLLEGDRFRQAMTRTVSSIAEGVAVQSARTAAEEVARSQIEKAQLQTAARSPTDEQTAKGSVHELATQLRRTTLVLGGGLALVILYLVARLFVS